MRAPAWMARWRNPASTGMSVSAGRGQGPRPGRWRMEEGTRKSVGCQVASAKRPERARVPEPGGGVHGGDAGGEVGVFDGFEKVSEVVGVPEIVVAQVSDELATGELEAEVVGAGLGGEAGCGVVPGDAGIGKGSDDGLGIVGAGVADDEELPVGEGLGEDGGDGAAEGGGPVD